jgi:hypothetical protein
MVIKASFKVDSPFTKTLCSRHILTCTYITLILMQTLTIACGRERHFDSFLNKTSHPLPYPKGLKSEAVKPSQFNAAVTPHCGLPCSNSDGCYGAFDGCTYCNAGFCDAPKGLPYKKGKGTKSKAKKTSQPKAGKSKNALCSGPDMTESYRASYLSSQCPNEKALERDICYRMKVTAKMYPCKTKFDCIVSCPNKSSKSKNSKLIKRFLQQRQQQDIVVSIEVEAKSPKVPASFNQDAPQAIMESVQQICPNCIIFSPSKSPYSSPSRNPVPFNLPSGTMIPTTIAPTTLSPLPTLIPTTIAPTTLSPLPTLIPTTVAPTTLSPLTSPSNPVPFNLPSGTVIPTTVAPTTLSPLPRS